MMQKKSPHLLYFTVTAALAILPISSSISFAGDFNLIATHPHAAEVNEPIKEIVIYNNALYLGYGNQERNEIAPLEVCHYRPDLEDLICDFTFGTSEIRNLKIIDNQLHIPSTDPAETVSYDGYAIYNAATNEWTRISARNFIEDEENKHDWLVHAVDVAKYNDVLWLTDTGGFPKNTHLKRRFGHFSGDLYRSFDGGKNWIRSNFPHTFNYSLFVFKGKLYNPSPVSYRDGFKNRPSLVYDGETWKPSGDFNLPRPTPHIRLINGEKMSLIFRLGVKLQRGVLDHLREFKGKALVLNSLRGSYLNKRGKAYLYAHHIGNILTASDDLSQDMDYDNIVLGDIDKFEFVNDYCVTKDKVYALMSNGEIRYSSDLKHWEIIDTKFSKGHPYSIEVHKNEIYIGTDNGQLYQYFAQKQIKKPRLELRNR